MSVVNTDNSGLRYDEGKSRIDLIPPECILALGDHYTKGAKKYKERNWEAGMDYHKCYSSLMRHALAWWGGEDNDPENGTNHMVAVAWNALALFWYQLKGVGKDDRPKYSKTNAPQEQMYIEQFDWPSPLSPDQYIKVNRGFEIANPLVTKIVPMSNNMYNGEFSNGKRIDAAVTPTRSN